MIQNQQVLAYWAYYMVSWMPLKDETLENLETEIISLDKFASDFSGLTSLSQAKKSSLAWESRLGKSDQLASSARTQILSHRLDQLASSLQPFIDQASPSSTLDLVKQKLGIRTTDLQKRYQLLLEAGNLLLQLP